EFLGTCGELVEHARRPGTCVGRRVDEGTCEVAQQWATARVEVGQIAHLAKGVLGDPARQPTVERLDHRVVTRLPQRLFRTEMVLYQPERNPSRFCDPPHRGALDAALGEVHQRGVPDPGARREIPRRPVTNAEGRVHTAHNTSDLLTIQLYCS